MPREILTPEERKARLKARQQRNHAKNREKRLAMMRTRHHATMATMTPEELEASRAERRKISARYADTHREEINAKDRANYWANPEKPRARRRAFYLTHLEQETAAKKRWREANPTTDQAGQIRWRKANTDKIKVRMVTWRAANPDKVYAALARRVARLRNAPRNDVTPEQRHAVIAAAQGVCVYCSHYKPDCTQCPKGTHKLTIDHITAVINGGPNTLHNLVACCKFCNSKKRTRPNPIPVQPLLL